MTYQRSASRQQNIISLSQNLETKIMGASFKNTRQVIKTLNAGADTVTIPPEIVHSMLSNPLVEAAIDKFVVDSAKLKEL
ncbi:transaldolase family protein [Marinilactibacillus psychrotolerans]|nr:transaldolase family protein [Marinilactibacillus psychrotolerans]